MFKGLFIYAACVGLLVGGISAGMDLPYGKALGMFAIGAIGVLSVAVPVLVVRLKPKRQPRQGVPRIGCDPVASKLLTSATAEPVYRVETTYEHYYSNQSSIKVEAPEHKLLEAPRKEMQAP